MNIPFLGEVPINIQIRINGDEGRLAGNYSDEQAAPFFERICYNLVKGLSESRLENPPLPTLSVL
jgi:ATP-binding protein involved in chromosome partitioning